MISNNDIQRNWNLPSIEIHIYSFIILLLFLLSFINLCINPSLLSSVIAGFFLNPLIGVSHNFVHQSDNKGFLGIETYWKYLMCFTLSSVENWQIHHVISHHQDINLNSDIEALAFEPFHNFMTNRPTNSIFIYLYIPIFYMFVMSIFHIPGLIIKYKKGDLIWRNLMPLVELFIMILMGDSVKYSIFYWMIMHGVQNVILMIISTPIHRSDYCWSEGDQNGTKDFIEHTLLTTHDYYVQAPLFISMLLFDTFNDHRIHHLFPTLDASKVEIIKPYFEKFCKKDDKLKKYFKGNYGMGQLIMGWLRNMHKCL